MSFQNFHGCQPHSDAREERLIIYHRTCPFKINLVYLEATLTTWCASELAGVPPVALPWGRAHRRAHTLPPASNERVPNVIASTQALRSSYAAGNAANDIGTVPGFGCMCRQLPPSERESADARENCFGCHFDRQSILIGFTRRSHGASTCLYMLARSLSTQARHISNASPPATAGTQRLERRDRGAASTGNKNNNKNTNNTNNTNSTNGKNNTI